MLLSVTILALVVGCLAAIDSLVSARHANLTLAAAPVGILGAIEIAIGIYRIRNPQWLVGAWKSAPKLALVVVSLPVVFPRVPRTVSERYGGGIQAIVGVAFVVVAGLAIIQS